MGKRISAVSEGREQHRGKRPTEPRDKEAGSHGKGVGGGGGAEKALSLFEEQREEDKGGGRRRRCVEGFVKVPA